MVSGEPLPRASRWRELPCAYRKFGITCSAKSRAVRAVSS